MDLKVARQNITSVEQHIANTVAALNGDPNIAIDRHPSVRAAKAQLDQARLAYDNTQAMHVALARDLVPYRAAAHVTGSIAEPGLAMLNDMITGQAALIGVIYQFKVMMIAMLIVSPLVLFLRKPRPANQQGA